MKFVDLLLYSEEGVNDFETLYKKHRASLGYLAHLPSDIKVSVVQHANFSDTLKYEGVTFSIRKARNRKWHVPFILFFNLRRQSPDLILVHSMIFSWQIVFLRLIIQRKCRILVQNHAERPGTGLRRVIERMAAHQIAGFLFVSRAQTEPWKVAGIISKDKPVFEIMEGSTNFSVNEIRQKSEGPAFLWVGRLDKNKDPLTILRAFAEFVKGKSQARLKMIYNAGNLKSDVERFIATNGLSERVSLIHNVRHEQMQEEYSRADYFLLGSHYEGSGFAVCEAMSCGCVPIVTNIPSFSTMVKNGEEGFLFSPGNYQELLVLLQELDRHSHSQIRKNVLEKFESELSFKAIGRKMAEIARLITVQREQ